MLKVHILLLFASLNEQEQTVIDITKETPVSLNEARASLPGRRSGKRPTLACMYRWSTKGCRGVILETIQVGATRCTSREALQRFFDRLTTQLTIGTQQPSLRSKNEESDESAERRLAAAGA